MTKKILEKSKDIEKDRTLMREKISELENEIRRKFGFFGTSMQLDFRKK